MSQTTSPGHTSEKSMSDSGKETASKVAHTAAEYSQDAAQHYVAEPAKDLVELMKDYAREKPDVAACWCFAIGVVIGWKLKP